MTIKEKYDALYEHMATSGKPENMKVFGRVMTEMMDWFIANRPDAAQEWVEQLCSVKWKNYLTQREAEKIVSGMSPKAPWPKDAWKNVLNNMGIATEEEPYYNECALWVTMCMVYSDSANSIARIIGAPLNNIPTEKMVEAVHALALDKLKDPDEVFGIRRYFGLT